MMNEIPTVTKKNGKSILSSVGWICVSLLFIHLIPPMLMFIPICIGIVLRRDYGEQQQGLAMILLAIVGTIVGFALGMYVSLHIL